LTPLQPPLIRRHCSRCSGAKPFACSLKFRTTAQKKRLDVWLIYRCSACDEVWNLPIYERAAIGEVDPLDAIARNDAGLALRHAFDRVRLSRHGTIEESSEVAIRRTHQSGCLRTAGAIAIALALARPCGMRLDRLLALGLGLSRGEIGRLHETGALSATRKALRNSAADGQVVAIDLAPLDPALADALRRGALA
jgi:hypothetical protein